MDTDDLIYDLQEAVQPELFQVEMWLMDEVPHIWDKLTSEDRLDLCRLLQEPFSLCEAGATEFVKAYTDSAFELQKSELIDTIREELQKEASEKELVAKAKELEDRAAQPPLEAP